MAAYAMVHIDVHDDEAYSRYRPLAAIAVAKYDGEFLARGGESLQLEGEGRKRNVIIRFADLATAKAFYYSPEYQEALTHALPASTREYVVVEGVE